MISSMRYIILLLLLITSFSNAFSSTSLPKSRSFKELQQSTYSYETFQKTRPRTNQLVKNAEEEDRRWKHGKKSLPNRVMDGLKVAPAIATLPLYGIGFGIVGPKLMWRFSKWIYAITNPFNNILHAHFDRVAAYLYSGSDIAAKKLVSYKVHPLFAALSLVSTAALAFFNDANIIKNALSYNQLLLVNMVICFVSAIATIPLHKIMIGNLNAKKWIQIQSKVSMLYAALSLCPGAFGRLMVHLTWAVLFVGGALERFYVLCVMSQMNIPDRKTYLKYYSPQFKGATVGAIPLGLATFYFFG